jgi:hypothetical protein
MFGITLCGVSLEHLSHTEALVLLSPYYNFYTIRRVMRMPAVYHFYCILPRNSVRFAVFACNVGLWDNVGKSQACSIPFLTKSYPPPLWTITPDLR